MTTNSLFIVLPRTSISKRFIFGLHVILTLALMATRAQADRLGGPGYVPEVAGHCIDTGEAADVRFDLGVVPGSAPATRSPGNHSSLIHAKIPTVPSWPVAQQAPPAAAAASSSPSPKPTAPHDTPTDVRDTTASPSEPPTECDRIAAPRPPILSSSDVHETNESDWRRGVEACQAEVKAHPEEIRFVYQLGRAQDKLKDYISALHNYKTAADAGYTDALLDLGILYYYGHGVVRNYSTAFENIKKAADAGSSKAMANVAAMYGDGLGVPKNPEKALDLAEKAIEAGAPFGLQ
ncbi:tetratricopeptide repeat protein, partial [Telmatospirillum sp.]|uniref:tetratricopeptide repeat protein n=1 Tax=Telmatospirillum sp. TaxID=2079197 RepID=UPI00284F9BA4|nr:hypothetical protein [Telmatospirillum sp.]